MPKIEIREFVQEYSDGRRVVEKIVTSVYPPYTPVPSPAPPTIKPSRRVQVSGRTYVTTLDVKVGDRVALPTPDWLRNATAPEYEGVVTSLEPGNYTGPCAPILRILT